MPPAGRIDDAGRRLREGQDRAPLRRLDGPAVGRILVEGEVSARPGIVREVADQDAAQVPFAKDEDMIQTLAADRADESLREGVLPQAIRRRQNFTRSEERSVGKEGR